MFGVTKLLDVMSAFVALALAAAATAQRAQGLSGCDRFVKLACFERRRSAWEHLEAETRQTAMIDLFG